MRFLEYEGKKILKNYGIKIPKGEIAETSREAFTIAEKIPGEVVIKSQIMAGKRGLAGGIKFADSPKNVKRISNELLGSKIKGLIVDKLLIEEKINIKNEYYVSIMLNRTEKNPVLLGTTEGGISIEEVGNKKPELISNIPVDTLVGVYNYHGYDLFSQFDIEDSVRKKLSDIITKMYKIFKDKEAFLVEINPLIITNEYEVIAGDCKLVIDPAASYSKQDNSPRYIPLDGNIGVFANGAGLTMTTMDVVKELGGTPANFLEVGGEFYKRADEAFEYLLEKKPNLSGIIVNLFGAYARTDVIIKQVIKVIEKRELDIPISFRVRGTGEKKATNLIKDKMNMKVHKNLTDAVNELLGKIQGVDNYESRK